jgi:hypothetical protein
VQTLTTLKALLGLAVAGLGLVVIDDLRLRQERQTTAELAAFSRIYRECTDRIDAEYQAKIDAEFAQERQAWGAKNAGELLHPSRLPFERPDYAEFIQRRVRCAK